VRRTNTITGPDPSSEKSQLLRAAFGPSALAHREMRIDIVTAVSVLVISIKLLAIRSLWAFLTAAHFIVFGWLLVQSLLLIFHSRELSDLDMASSIRAARLLDAALKESSQKYQFSYVALHAPFLGYIGYALAFQLELPPWLQWFSDGVEIILAIPAQIVSFVLFYWYNFWCTSVIAFGTRWCRFVGNIPFRKIGSRMNAYSTKTFRSP
jgi:hypothetical protein